MEQKFYFGGGNPFGENKPDDIFYKNILPILKKYKVKDKDIVNIANHIGNMCETAYANGIESEAFDRSEME